MNNTSVVNSRIENISKKLSDATNSVTLRDGYRPIPNCPGYLASATGNILEEATGKVLALTNKDGYYVTTIKLPTTLRDNTPTNKVVQVRVHRLVASAWVPNPDPDNKTDVNHIDGNKGNNHYTNLEWVTKAENNRHAFATGLMGNKEIACLVRDYETGEVHEFKSHMDAARFVGYDRPVNKQVLCPRLFGKLVKDRYEVRFPEDNRPWFYETRTEKVCSRYRLEVIYPDGRHVEFFSKLAVIRSFKAYGFRDKTFRDLVNSLIVNYPTHKFIFEDALGIMIPGIDKLTSRQLKNLPLLAYNREKGYRFLFDSIRSAADFLEMDRFALARRINVLSDNSKGWVFIQGDYELVELHELEDRVKVKNK